MIVKDELYKDITLLIDGKNAFPVILNFINNAKKSIKINMFIWRDDDIGNKIANAVLEAANRGVKIEISKDRYGVVLEKSEEEKKSFFHKKQSLIEKVKIKTLELFYPMPNTPKKAKDEETDIYLKLMNHPNIIVSKDTFKADHSKYYIFDDEILILGGINIEDKENGKDKQGRIYQDYMVKLTGQKYVYEFLTKYKDKVNLSGEIFFGINYRESNDKFFEMERLYLDMINSSKKELYITMAYFSPLKKFLDAIVEAYQRGVKINILIPEKANYQSDSNLKTIKQLLKRTNNGIKVYLSKKMVHTKMIINENYISFGSSNITKKAFKQLMELNIFVKNEDSEFKELFFESINENYRLSTTVNSYQEIKYNKFYAFIEGFLV